MNFNYIGVACPSGIQYDITFDNSVVGYLEYAPPGLNVASYVTEPFVDYFFEGGVEILRSTLPAEVGGPVPTASTVECVVDATEPTTLPVVQDICGNVLTPATAVKQSLFLNDFSEAVVLSATQAPDVWYTDRYAPAGFVSQTVFDGDVRLKHSIDAADGSSSRPPSYSSSFYNTQGRKYDLGVATDYAEIELYVPSAWATTNKRMAGFWVTPVDASDVVSAYAIVEFTSDNGNPRFQTWESAEPGGWYDMGLPSGFTYDSWITLKIRLLPSGELYCAAGSLTYQTITNAPGGSVRIDNTILQGYNYDPTVPGGGVTYDIYWDNFKWNDTYAEPACEGFITYTFDYEDCAGVIFPWMYTYTVEHSSVPVVPADGGSTVYNIADAVAPSLPAVTDVCGVTLTGVLESIVDVPDPFTYPGTRTYTYSFTDCADLSSEWKFVYTIPGVEVSGIVTYYNSSNTPMVGEEVKLFQGTEKYSATTLAGGAFTFNNVAPGTYDVVVSTTKNKGGINSTDAAQANYWSVSVAPPSLPIPIQQVRFYAGDVIGTDFKILANDAGHIQQYFLTLGNPSPAFTSDWTFWNVDEMIGANPGAGGYPQITVTGAAATMTNNMYALVTGDFNRSYTPTSKASASETLTLNYGENIEIGAAEFELPLYAGMDMNVGAISLILNVPADMLEVQDVYLGNNPNASMLWSVVGDELRISWQSLDAISLQKGEAMLTLKLSLLAPAGDEGIRLSLVDDPLNELADDSYNVINDAMLVVNIVHTTYMGTNEPGAAGQLTFAANPNPFRQTTNFVYSLPASGQLNLEIYDMLGNKVKTLVNESQLAGEHQLAFNANTLKPGIYIAVIRLQNTDTILTQTIKLVSK
jgi:hypothetical protein